VLLAWVPNIVYLTIISGCVGFAWRGTACVLELSDGTEEDKSFESSGVRSNHCHVADPFQGRQEEPQTSCVLSARQ
jgi:hypothetical protein